MKFKVSDQVIITSGKDKGKKSQVLAVYPEQNQVLVQGINYFVKHVKAIPSLNRPGERVRKERALSVGKVAIINEKGQPDRIGYKIINGGKKIRIFKKTGSEIKETQPSKNIATKTKKNSSNDKDNQDQKKKVKRLK